MRTSPEYEEMREATVISLYTKPQDFPFGYPKSAMITNSKGTSSSQESPNNSLAYRENETDPHLTFHFALNQKNSRSTGTILHLIHKLNEEQNIRGLGEGKEYFLILVPFNEPIILELSHEHLRDSFSNTVFGEVFRLKEEEGYGEEHKEKHKRELQPLKIVLNKNNSGDVEKVAAHIQHEELGIHCRNILDMCRNTYTYIQHDIYKMQDLSTPEDIQQIRGMCFSHRPPLSYFAECKTCTPSNTVDYSTLFVCHICHAYLNPSHSLAFDFKLHKQVLVPHFVSEFALRSWAEVKPPKTLYDFRDLGVHIIELQYHIPDEFLDLVEGSTPEVSFIVKQINLTKGDHKYMENVYEEIQLMREINRIDEFPFMVRIFQSHITPLWGVAEIMMEHWYTPMHQYKSEEVWEKDKFDILSNFGTHISHTSIFSCWFLDLADTLYTLHLHQIVHLDVKPENILIHYGIPKLIDLGTSLSFSGRRKDELDSVFAVTQQEIKLLKGTTKAFAPPEFLLGGDFSFDKCDIFTLGLSFVEVVFGLDYETMNQLSKYRRDAESPDTFTYHLNNLMENVIQSGKFGETLEFKFQMFIQVLKYALKFKPELRPTSEELYLLMLFFESRLKPANETEFMYLLDNRRNTEYMSNMKYVLKTLQETKVAFQQSLSKIKQLRQKKKKKKNRRNLKSKLIQNLEKIKEITYKELGLKNRVFCRIEDLRIRIMVSLAPEDQMEGRRVREELSCLVEIKRRIFGENHPITADALVNQVFLGSKSMYLNRSTNIPNITDITDITEIIDIDTNNMNIDWELLQQALKIHLKFHGLLHPATVQLVSDMGSFWFAHSREEAERVKKASEYFMKAEKLGYIVYGGEPCIDHSEHNSPCERASMDPKYIQLVINNSTCVNKMLEIHLRNRFLDSENINLGIYISHVLTTCVRIITGVCRLLGGWKGNIQEIQYSELVLKVIELVENIMYKLWERKEFMGENECWEWILIISDLAAHKLLPGSAHINSLLQEIKDEEILQGEVEMNPRLITKGEMREELYLLLRKEINVLKKDKQKY